MKRLIRTVATAVLASIVLAGGPAAAKDRDHDRGRWDRGRWEQDERGHRGDGGFEDRAGPGDRGERGGPPVGRWEGRGPDGRWEAGPPPAYGYSGGYPGGYPGPPAYGRRLPPPGYGLRRGGIVPPEARGAIVPDYGRHRLRPPPPGFAWVRMGDRYMLVSRATGQIFDVIGR